MSKEAPAWDDDALERLKKIPAFVRPMVKGKIEKAVVAAGEDRVTAAFMDTNRAKLMG
jgi:hypothetical protein